MNVSSVPCPLHHLAQDMPDIDAIIWSGGRSISWQALDSYVHSTARRLKECGVREGSRVALLASTSVGFLIVFLSLWRIRAVACPLNPKLSLNALKDVFDLIQPQLLIVDNERKDLSVKQLLLEDMIVIEVVEGFYSAGFDRQETVEMDQDALVVLTSGSTGSYKPAVLSYGNFYQNALGAHEAIPFEAGDKWLLSLPLYHVSGLSILFRALVKGGTIEVSAGNDLLSDFQVYSPTHISLVPAQFFRLMDDPKVSQILRDMKCILVGGAPIPQALIDRSFELGLPLFLTYGLTETASQVATGRAKGNDKEFVACILNDRGVKVAPDGEILVKGSVVFKGYLEKAGLNTAKDSDGWFPTSDIGIVKDGYLKITGRKDNMFVSGGENIVPEMIEKVLLTCPGVVAAIVCPKPDPKFGQVPVAFLKFKDGFSSGEKDIKAFLMEKLLRFQMPKAFYRLSEDLSNDLKPRRKELAALVSDSLIKLIA